MKTYIKKSFLVLSAICMILVFSCSKDEQSDTGGIKVYYVIEGIYDAIPGQSARDGQVEVIASMTMPSGNSSQGNVLTPYTSETRDYASGMTVTVYAESVLSYTTITVKIYKNGTLWKTNTATETGFGNYAVATISGTL